MQVEGTSAKLTRTQSAYASIASSTYLGQQKGFAFSNYVTLHQTAHNELQEFEEPVSESKKVTDFLKGIRDPVLNTGKSIVLGDREKLRNFEECQQFLSIILQNMVAQSKSCRLRSDLSGGRALDLVVGIQNHTANGRPSTGCHRPDLRICDCNAEESCISDWRAPVLTERCLAVASRLESQLPIKLCDDSALGDKLAAAVNIESFDVLGDGLGPRPDDSLCCMSEMERQISALLSKDRGPVLTKEIIAQRWGIGLDTAQKTLATTTQYGVRRILHPVEHSHRTRQMHLRFPTLNTKLYNDTMFSATKSLRGHTCAQVLTDLCYPLKKESEASSAMNEVIRTVGVLKELVLDGANAETQGRFAELAREYRIKQRQTEPYSGWQNRTEVAIQEVKRWIKRVTLRARSPKRLWDFCGEWVATIRRLTAHDIPGLQRRVPSQ